MKPTAPTPRYADMDFIRVLAIALLHLFHTGMMFNTWPWHIKNADLLPVLTTPWQVLAAFRMPLLMVVAGAGTAWALRRRSLGVFARDRLMRLGLPLLVGIFLIVPPQIYIERLVQGVCAPTYLQQLPGSGFAGSFWEFYPSVFAMRPFPVGNTSWHHLWFVAYLLTFCMAALPVFAWFQHPSGQRALAAVERWFSGGIRLYLLAFPLILVQVLLRSFPQTCDLLHDPRTLAYYGLLFGYGHLLGRCPNLMDRIVSLRRQSLGWALLLLGLLLPDGAFPFPLETAATFAFVWMLVLTLIGHARAHVHERRPWLIRAQEVAFPFYILHQTIIVLVGYALLHASLGPWIKMATVFGVSFAITAGLCDVIRRIPWLRPLFGMPPVTIPPPTVASPLVLDHTSEDPRHA